MNLAKSEYYLAFFFGAWRGGRLRDRRIRSRARHPSWSAAVAYGLATGIVQLATGADHGVGSDSGNCDTAAQHCKFFFNKVTTIGATWSIVGDFYAILARYEA
jgi:hypothetical protein